MDLLGHTRELISDFTQHGNPKGEHLCRIYKEIVQAVVNTGIAILSTVTSGFAGPVLGAPTTAIGKVFNPTIKYGPKSTKGEQAQITFGLYAFLSQQVESWTVGHWQNWKDLVEKRITREQPIISTGMGRGWSGMCASVEGDFQDQSTLNMQNLQEYLSQSFQHTREAIYEHFNDIYTGGIRAQPGQPSMMAAIMAHREWVGEDSIVCQLEDSRPVRR